MAFGEHPPRRPFWWRKYLRDALSAQPAEAEGAVQCPASHPAECYAPGTQVVHASLVHGIVRKADELIAALSAVTAERDAARTDLATVIGQRDCYANQVLRLETTVTAERDRLLAEREGKALVPVEPTIEMIAALGFGGDVALAIGHAAISAEVEQTYQAMLSAAMSAKEA